MKRNKIYQYALLVALPWMGSNAILLSSPAEYVPALD